jgi:hypothetical protein
VALLLEVGLGAVVIEVVLPTYNGAAYLEQQLASIDGQSLRPERVLIRDDGSTDATLNLLNQLQCRYGTWLEILPGLGGENMGCVASVNLLLQATTAPYVAFADQDDVWFAKKLESSLEKIKDLESRHGSGMPLMVHSDLQLVDAHCGDLGVTYLQRQKLDPFRCGPADLALTNVVTGCSVLVNRALLRRALPIPAEALMHDWWLALVASVFGEIALLDVPLLAYRQHDANVLGSQGLGLGYWLDRLRTLLAGSPAGLPVLAASRQAQVFEERYGYRLSMLPALMAMPRRERWRTLCVLSADQRLSKHGPLRTLGLYVLLLCLPGSAGWVDAPQEL